MKTLRGLALVLTLSAPAAPVVLAQTGTVSGSVYNSDTRTPIEGALVQMSGTSYGALTGANGRFTILSIPPGTYRLSATRFGFAGREVVGVDVQIGRTRTVAFGLRPSQLGVVDTAAFAPPLVDPAVGKITNSITTDQIVSLPSLNLAGALGLGGSYLELPRTAATISIQDIYRGITSVATIRGARPEATLYLLDGIPVSNPLFGYPPILADPFAIASVTVSPSHADPEDGPALAGVVSQSIREGGQRLSGAFEYQTSAIPAKLGSVSSSANASSTLRGYIGGPMPFTRDRLRFMLSGNVQGERANVSRFGTLPWQGSGEYATDQFIGKLTYMALASVKLSLTALRDGRTMIGTDPQILEGDTVAIPTMRDAVRMITARVEKRFAAASLSLAAARVSEERQTCSIWNGVCVVDRIARIPHGSEIPAFGEPPREAPYDLSGQFYGMEQRETRMIRADLIAQPSDHHEVRLGMHAAMHDIDYADVTAFAWLQGVVRKQKDAYRARPVEFATYVQDAIQYDFVTVHFGARFDYGSTGGFAFTNPADPTNGTTAREICDGKIPGISDAPWQYGGMSGVAACVNSPVNNAGTPSLLDSAARLAQRDDLHPVRPRAAFAPRVALSFPLSEKSGMFLDIGRYARNPLYHNAYRYTGTGTRAGVGAQGDDICQFSRRRPGTTECPPNLTFDERLPAFVGNADLGFEMSDGFEAGFTTETKNAHGVEASAFVHTQSHLPRLYLAELKTDIARTYGLLTPAGGRTVLSNGSSTVFGISLTIRKPRRKVLSYTLNWTWQRSDEIGTIPDLVAATVAAGLKSSFSRERVSPRGRAHVLNALVSAQWLQHTPVPFGRLGELLLRNSRTSLTAYMGTSSQEQSRPLPAAFENGVSGTPLLANLQYTRTLNSNGAQWALIVRARNIFDNDDGVRFAPVGSEVSRRRMLAGLSVGF